MPCICCKRGIFTLSALAVNIAFVNVKLYCYVKFCKYISGYLLAYFLMETSTYQRGILPKCYSTLSFQVYSFFKNCVIILNEIHCLFPKGLILGLYLKRFDYWRLLPRRHWSEQEELNFLMFATNPTKQMIRLKVSQFFNSSPATLAGIGSGSFLFHQLCF